MFSKRAVFFDITLQGASEMIGCFDLLVVMFYTGDYGGHDEHHCHPDQSEFFLNITFKTIIGFGDRPVS